MSRDVRYWDRISGRPMKLVENLKSRPAYEALIRTALQLSPGDRVLDVGCGTGNYLQVLREAVGEEGEVLGIDYSPKMAEKAKARAEQWHNVEVRQADATTVDLPESHYDAVLASFSISATQNVQATVANTPVIWTFRTLYRAMARWTGVDVLTTIQAQFGNAQALNTEGKPLATLPKSAPVLMITAQK